MSPVVRWNSNEFFVAKVILLICSGPEKIHASPASGEGQEKSSTAPQVSSRVLGKESQLLPDESRGGFAGHRGSQMQQNFVR